MAIPGRDLLAQIESDPSSPAWQKLGVFLRNYMIPSIQTTASNAAVSSESNIRPPAAPESINVSTSGEMMQVQVNHSAPIQKGIQYLTHIANNPQMTNAIVVDHGSSRSPAHIPLPSRDAAGNPHSYYVATVAQYPGSHPSAPTFFGGSTPVAVQMTGATQMDLLPGTGSGTAQNGAETLVGLGKAQVRLQVSAKRTV